MDVARFLRWIPGWLGFLAAILVGSAMTINGAANRGLDPANKRGFLVFGVALILVGAFSWIVGGSSKIKGREGKVGVKVEATDMPWWAWLVDVGLVGAAILIYALGR